MSLVFYLFIALLSLSVLVFFHELGHYTVAKFFGVKIESFNIGFGKVLARKHCCDTVWAFRALPLGGYVHMKGQNDANPLERSSDSDSYDAKRPWQRIIISLAGPFANLILAFFVYVVLALIGTPFSMSKTLIDPVVASTSSNSPAQKAGIVANDKIISINGHKIEFWNEIGKRIQEAPVPIKIIVQRNKKEVALDLIPQIVKREDINGTELSRKIIGIIPHDNGYRINKDMHGIEILTYAWQETVFATKLIAGGIKKITTGEVSHKEVGGAISIFDAIMNYAKRGIAYLLFIMALISVNLGVLNLLPIPALDGGHIMFNLYEIITRREPSEAALYYLTMLGWAMLFGLMGLGLYNDATRMWG